MIFNLLNKTAIRYIGQIKLDCISLLNCLTVHTYYCKHFWIPNVDSYFVHFNMVLKKPDDDSSESKHVALKHN